jgi:glutamate synthase domain-containing protein 3
MTGGTVVVIGDVGRNFRAGMTGGVAMVWDPTVGLTGRLAETSPAARRADELEQGTLRALLEEHYDRTGSPIAGRLLEEAGSLEDFWVVEPTGDVDQPSELIIDVNDAAEVGD